MVYNSLEQRVTRTLRIPLYYTGKTATASVASATARPRPSSWIADTTSNCPSVFRRVVSRGLS